MRYHRVLRSAAILFLVPGALYAGQITFVYPPDGTAIPASAKTFVFGNISPSTAALTINGERVQVHSNGGFIAYLPVSTGDFAFNASLDDGATAQRRIKVREASDARASTGTLRLELTTQTSDSEVLAGDYIRVAAFGTPGRQAVFSLGKLAKDLPLLESPAGSGRYYGHYKLKATDQVGEFTPAARFKAGLFARGASAKAKGTVKVLKAPVLVETSTEAVVLRDSPEGGSLMFLPKGVKLVSTGRANGARRVSLAADMEAWVDESKVQPAPGVPYTSGPLTETGSIKLKKTDFGSSATVSLYEKVPYTAEPTENGLRVTLYYTSLHTNYVMYDSSDTLVRNVAFRQAQGNTVEIDFETGPGALWGYNVSYSAVSRGLQVDLRAAPKPSLAWPKPLSGIVVVLDPGHSPFLKCENNLRPPLQSVRYSSLPASAHCTLDGAVGPMETFEVNVNMAIAQKLKKRLLEFGAEVRMTRNGEENVDLPDRPKLAKDLGGDIFISMHNNAIGDGEDPFTQPRGFTVYYYQRQSKALATALHAAYLKDIPLPDEGMRYGDYLVVRLTWMPAALIESAYMILPRQEEQLNTPVFQDQLASAAAEGVLNFFHVQPQSKKAKK